MKLISFLLPDFGVFFGSANLLIFCGLAAFCVVFFKIGKEMLLFVSQKEIDTVAMAANCTKINGEKRATEEVRVKGCKNGREQIFSISPLVPETGAKFTLEVKAEQIAYVGFGINREVDVTDEVVVMPDLKDLPLPQIAAAGVFFCEKRVLKYPHGAKGIHCYAISAAEHWFNKNFALLNLPNPA